ncbi:MAG: 2-oxoacid:acceptor oxidoreductase family protein [Syntrophales bacterium]|nr:2-oxoacid:acceptor oxidoreductase family protein [Syntrophales bacterium]
MQKRHDVILTGIGGMGVLLTGEMIVRSAPAQYKNVLWIPNYTTAQRGAPCDCIVILSDEEIYSPLVDQAEAVVVMAASQLKAFENRAKPGGFILLETYGLSDKATRTDVRVIPMSAIETAAKRGDRLGANMVALGMYVEISRAVAPEHIEKTITAKFAKKKKELHHNLELFREGLELGTQVDSQG